MKYDMTAGLVRALFIPLIRDYLQAALEKEEDVPTEKVLAANYRFLVEAAEPCGAPRRSQRSRFYLLGLLLLSVYRLCGPKLRPESAAGLIEVLALSPVLQTQIVKQKRRFTEQEAWRRLNEGLSESAAEGTNGWTYTVSACGEEETKRFELRISGCALYSAAEKEDLEVYMPYICLLEKRLLEHLAGDCQRSSCLAEGDRFCRYEAERRES